MDLAKNIRWKISCRPDDLEPEILESMLEDGLFAVYLGVESGCEAGLRELNKMVSVKRNIEAINLLKSHNVALAIGFMLFDPSSTLVTILKNVEFLKLVGEDGYFPINFCKMLPYAGTPIEEKLKAANRLIGSVIAPNYAFNDTRVDWYEFLTRRIFSKRNFGPDGNVALLQDADFDCRLEKSMGRKNYNDAYDFRLRELIKRSNKKAVEILEELMNELVAKDVDYLLDEQETIIALAEREWREEKMIEDELGSINEKCFNEAY
jgi:radical SAM superfamily enzyme YgiQ (UPF0313 family)